MDVQELTERLAGKRSNVTNTRRDFLRLVRTANDQPTIIDTDGEATAAIIGIKPLRLLVEQAEAYRLLEAARIADLDATEYQTADNFIAAMNERTAARRAARQQGEERGAA